MTASLTKVKTNLIIVVLGKDKVDKTEFDNETLRKLEKSVLCC